MPATVRLGTCSWADEGPSQGVVSAGGLDARRRACATTPSGSTLVEVDSPFYALPDPDVTGRWAERTPDAFTFHVKAGAAMTFHEGEPADAAFAAFRARSSHSSSPGSCAACCCSTTPASSSREEAKDELARARATTRASRAAGRVSPSLLDGPRRALRHAGVPRGAGARLRLGRCAVDAGDERRAPRRRGNPPRLGDPLPRPQRADVEHPWWQRRRPLRLDVLRRGACRVDRADAPALRAGGRGLRALQQQPRRLRAAQRSDLPWPARRGGDRRQRAGSTCRRRR